MLIRLNKYIADSGIASRRKAEEFILQGRVGVNNKIITELGFRVNDESDIVTVDDEKINLKKHLYYLLNKPKGVVTTTDDDKKRETVVDLINVNERIYPVGRLDYNTTGVLLLTNDGDFANLLTHPGNKVPKEYEVKLDKGLLEEDRIRLLKGINIDDRKSTFIKVSTDATKKNITVTAVEGRNHFVKRMFGALGYTVIKLNRKNFAGIKADIPPGSYRKLTRTEIERLFNQYAK
ncbi:MAG TPA: pseudouridine synthase [Ignavibacteriaceae bacterium]|jgi:23S rRNA pseudouridine2605 synthase